MDINSTNQEKIKYAEYGTPHTIRAQMLKTIPPAFWKKTSHYNANFCKKREFHFGWHLF